MMNEMLSSKQEQCDGQNRGDDADGMAQGQGSVIFPEPFSPIWWRKQWPWASAGAATERRFGRLPVDAWRR